MNTLILLIITAKIAYYLIIAIILFIAADVALYPRGTGKYVIAEVGIYFEEVEEGDVFKVTSTVMDDNGRVYIICDTEDGRRVIFNPEEIRDINKYVYFYKKLFN